MKRSEGDEAREVTNTKALLENKAGRPKEKKRFSSANIYHSVHLPEKLQETRTEHSHALSCLLNQLNIKLSTYYK